MCVYSSMWLRSKLYIWSDAGRVLLWLHWRPFLGHYINLLRYITHDNATLNLKLYKFKAFAFFLVIKWNDTRTAKLDVLHQTNALMARIWYVHLALARVTPQLNTGTVHTVVNKFEQLFFIETKVSWTTFFIRAIKKLQFKPIWALVRQIWAATRPSYCNVRSPIKHCTPVCVTR